MENLKLYNYFRSSTSFRVRIALNIKKLNYEYIPVHLLTDGGDQNKFSYRQLNPAGGVPTLVHDQTTVSQSVAILEYLDEVFPQTYQLLPKNNVDRAAIRQFCQIINSDMHAYNNLKTLKYLDQKLLITSDQKSAWSKHWLSDGLSACENTLKKSNSLYCFGDSVTMADVLLIPQLFTAVRFEIDIKQYPTLFKINENCMLNESFIKAHPFRQIDTPVELKIK